MTQKPPYELIDHTADFGLQVFGQGARELFHNAALALMDLLTDTAPPRGRQVRRISVAGRDWPDLMVNWLREILYLWAGEELLVRSIRIDAIGATRLSAQVETELFSPQHHVIKTEIKAVTYHQIRVSNKDDRWEARVIFDI